MGQRAYARHRGVDEKAIRKAVAAGKIELFAGKIDPAKADLSWAPTQPAGKEPRYGLSGLSLSVLIQLRHLVVAAIRDNRVPEVYGDMVLMYRPHGLKTLLRQLDALQAVGLEELRRHRKRSLCR